MSLASLLPWALACSSDADLSASPPPLDAGAEASSSSVDGAVAPPAGDAGRSVARTGPPGSLDTAFGGKGYLVRSRTAGAPISDDRGASVVVDRARRIVIAGDSTDGSGHRNVAVWRFGDDGATDTTFGVGGFAVHKNLAGQPFALGRAVCVDEADRVVVAGQANIVAPISMFVGRLDGTGGLDAAFGVGGFLTTTNSVGGGLDEARAIACGSRSIVVAGTSGLGMATWRVDAKGALDATTFSPPKGLVAAGALAGAVAPNNTAAGLAVTVEASGRVVIGGMAFDGTGKARALVWRYLADGTPDASWGTAGAITLPGAEVTGVAVRDGSTYALANDATRASLYRLGASGGIDSATILLPEPGADTSRGLGLAIDSRGRGLVAGTSRKGVERSKAAVWRVLSTGTADPSFASGGLFVMANTGGAPTASADGGTVAVLDDVAASVASDDVDRPVVTGSTFLPDQTRALALWRLNP